MAKASLGEGRSFEGLEDLSRSRPNPAVRNGVTWHSISVPQPGYDPRWRRAPRPLVRPSTVQSGLVIAQGQLHSPHAAPITHYSPYRRTESPTLHVPSERTPIPFKLLSWNLNNDRRLPEELSFERRLPAILEVVRREDPDLIAFQEVLPRQLYCDLSPAFGETHGFVASQRSPGEREFVNVLFWRRERFFLLQNSTVWMSDMPHLPSSTLEGDHVYGRAVLLAQLVPTQDSQVAFTSFGSLRSARMRQVIVPPLPLTVMVAHLAVPEVAKREQVAFLRHLIETQVHPQSSLVLAGDFNFFADQEGPHQRAILIDAGLHDTRAQLAFRLQDGSHTPCDRTFVPFSLEGERVQEILDKEDGVIDAIFVRAVQVEGVEVLPYVLEETANPTLLQDTQRLRDYVDRTPSDHLPLLLTATWTV